VPRVDVMKNSFTSHGRRRLLLSATSDVNVTASEAAQIHLDAMTNPRTALSLPVETLVHRKGYRASCRIRGR